jgi:hypothetical protein
MMPSMIVAVESTVGVGWVLIVAGALIALGAVMATITGTTPAAQRRRTWSMGLAGTGFALQGVDRIVRGSFVASETGFMWAGILCVAASVLLPLDYRSPSKATAFWLAFVLGGAAGSVTNVVVGENATMRLVLGVSAGVFVVVFVAWTRLRFARDRRAG